jgi:hypothetical protein
VYLGDALDNPPLGAVTVGGAAVADGAVVDTGVDVELTVAAADTDRVDWFTSLGELSDADDAAATLVPDGAVTSGDLAVVVRDAAGGVAWGYWSLAVQ